MDLSSFLLHRHLYKAILGKMLIKCKDMVNFFNFHNGKASTIRKAEILICKLLKNALRTFFNHFIHMHNSNDITLPQLASEFDGGSMP